MRTRETVWPGDTHFSRHAIGSYGRDAWACALTYLKYKRVFVDAGAHVGHFVYNAIGVFKEVIAFEPVPTNFKCLEANVFNRQSKIKAKTSTRLFRAAVGDVEIHKADVWYTDPSNGNNSGAWELSLTENGGQLLETDFLTLDSLRLEVCDLVKIDTQGWESRILKGGKALIEAKKPVLVVEVINENKFNNALHDELRALKYQMCAIVQKNGIFRHEG
jgi:FkbM family methyltransferase